MRIKRASKWEMACPYCGADLIFTRRDVTNKTLTARECSCLDWLDKLIYRKKLFTSDCITCAGCDREIQVGLLDKSHDYPIWAVEYEEIEPSNKIEDK